MRRTVPRNCPGRCILTLSETHRLTNKVPPSSDSSKQGLVYPPGGTCDSKRAPQGRAIASGRGEGTFRSHVDFYVANGCSRQLREIELKVQREINEKRQELLAKEESLRYAQTPFFFFFLERSTKFTSLTQEPRESTRRSRVASRVPRLIYRSVLKIRLEFAYTRHHYNYCVVCPLLLALRPTLWILYTVPFFFFCLFSSHFRGCACD
jgi:hypothetical protein